jgi:Skp family chaperone for outer membrane proteins
VQAQQMKIAYIDAAKLLKRMPEATDATSRLDQLIANWNREADDIQNDLTRKQAEFDRRKLIMTDAERTSAEVELQSLRKRLDEFRQSKYGANGDLFVQQSQLMKSAYDRLGKAITEAAQEGSYDYVIDRSSKDVVLLYANSKYDLTLNVARKLGIESEILSTPLINNGPKKGTQSMPPQNQPGNVPKNNPGVVPAATPTPGVSANPNTSNPNSPPSFNSGSNNPEQTPRPPVKENNPATPKR